MAITLPYRAAFNSILMLSTRMMSLIKFTRAFIVWQPSQNKTKRDPKFSMLLVYTHDGPKDYKG